MFVNVKQELVDKSEITIHRLTDCLQMDNSPLDYYLLTCCNVVDWLELYKILNSTSCFNNSMMVTVYFGDSDNNLTP